jgi:hypothetical protein
MQVASLSGNSENMMTPSRMAFFARRNQAILAARARQSEAAEIAAVAATDGVLPWDSDRHVIRPDAFDYNWVGGILTVDGAVHLFNRRDYEHADYAEEYLDGANIKCGGSYDSGGERDGWGFYVDPNMVGDYIGSGYMVPEEFHNSLENCVAKLIASRNSNSIPVEITAPKSELHRLLAEILG